MRSDPADPADYQPGSKEHRCGGCSCARPSALHPRTAKSSAQSQQNNRCAERGVRRAEPPRIVGEQRMDRTVKSAPGVYRSDANVHSHGGNRNEPAAEGGGGFGRGESCLLGGHGVLVLTFCYLGNSIAMDGRLHKPWPLKATPAMDFERQDRELPHHRSRN